MSFTRLQQKIDQMENPTVAGLDPALGNIPPQLLDKHISERGETLEAAALAVLEFNIGLINGLHDIVPAVKPQAAFYEALGVPGIGALKHTCEYAKSKGMYVIMDAKRGDIGSTAAAYSSAYLGTVTVGNTVLAPFDADALTVNAYLGTDGIKPFLEAAVQYDKAFFVLVRTSNPSAEELQNKLIARNCGIPMRTLSTAVGDLIKELAAGTADEYGYARIGAVVGATYPGQMKFLRKRLKNTFFLVPGYGAQGGSAADAAYAFDKNGRGAVVNSSRGIITAWKNGGTDYVQAARNEAMRMRDELRKEIYSVQRNI